ncbi:Uncharacterised protein [Yersinia pseudotuberculosis]|uniref:Integral membrane protein n=1 Tax=Yersinia wautersii TaxID=1341643 RepID=A0ABP1ZCW3_9GAMM|nr:MULTISPECIES: hypothetical protein [Yersinia pseudotuberculosis complex]CFV22269.1 Uncharacterised protein [Yersinia pseudotuberculosis]CNL25139.1 Uncharacterised protein [Yersinia pseudotuberculosis]CRG50559.1 Uncharacterised protein [Yersinia wautersii]
MENITTSVRQMPPVRNITAALSLVALLSLLGALATYIGNVTPTGWPEGAKLASPSFSFIDWFRWWLGDMSEATFYKNELASSGMLIGALIAYYASKKTLKWQGFSISYGTGLLPWILLSSFIGLTLSNIIWGWVIERTGEWQPTFVAFVSLPATLVLMFGRGWRIAILGGVMGALLVAPSSLLLVNYFCYPLKLPVVIGNVSGMAIGSLIGVAIFRKFPSLKTNRTPQEPPPEEIKLNQIQKYGPKWTVRRILADFTESPFFGNEIASIGLIIGILLAVALNPALPVYGSGLLTQVLTAQALASAIGVVVWRKQWITRGWYPTYVPVVSVAPAAVLVYGGTVQVIIMAATLGALIAPPLAAAISDRLPSDIHPYVGNVLSMAISTLITIPLMGVFIISG